MGKSFRKFNGVRLFWNNKNCLVKFLGDLRNLEELILKSFEKGFKNFSPDFQKLIVADLFREESLKMKYAK